MSAYSTLYGIFGREMTEVSCAILISCVVHVSCQEAKAADAGALGLGGYGSGSSSDR